MAQLPRPTLPDPDAAARDHSTRVVAAVIAAIDAAGGFISFARYMEIALYAPGLGYYVTGTRKFGADGDFVTAPEITPLFAQTLAVQVAAVLAATPHGEVLELGAGSGALAADLLNALAVRDALPSRYAILDVSPDLRERQRATIARGAPEHLVKVAWLDALPESINGAVLANEVLDAIPAYVVGRKDNAWFERGVARSWVSSAMPGEVRGVERSAASDSLLQLADSPLPHGPLRDHAAERYPATGDYVSEVNPAAEALVEDIARRLTAGALLIIDYGFPQAEFYHPQRASGTLMAHYRHYAHADPLLWPGLSDLTTHVDFTATAMAGTRAGLQIAGYASQAGFLLDCGLLEQLRAVGDPRSVAYLRAASAVQKLTSPAEMGELFKVLALTRTAAIEWPGFAGSDRSHRL